MKYLKKLQNIKAPSASALLDIALLLSIIPHLFVMKLFMLFYLFVALVFIFRNKSGKKEQYFLMMLGLILIAVSFFNNYNFSDFSRMQFFVSLISSLLIYAVSLQKLTKQVNIYLKISPALLMLLSFFFFESITMLLYTVFVLFIFVLLNIWSRMNVNFIDILKFTSKLFVLSLPFVVILFLVFPRISFKKADFGFRADSYSVSGYDGTMNVTTSQIRLSNKIVMEVLFEDKNISQNELYFRGSTLYSQNNLEWSSVKNIEDKLLNASRIIKYDITLYPNANRWIYALDIPFKAPKNTVLNRDYTLKSNKIIYTKKRYTLNSALSYQLISNISLDTYKVYTKKSDRTYEALKSIASTKVSDAKKAQLLLEFFKEQNIAYSLNPKDIDTDDFTDSFLFDAKNGYCVHFASAFANSARMLGIASRVVTGFKPDKSSMVNNYLVVRSKDAHAWVELYLDNQGWVRFDPTSTAIMSSDATQNVQIQNRQEDSLFQKINLNFMYVKYLINNWILDYNRLKQLSILNSLINDTIYLVKFILSILGVFLLSFLLYINIKDSSCKDKLMCLMQKLEKLLNKKDINKKQSESMQDFLQKAQNKLGISLQEINKLYHKQKYSKNFSDEEFDKLAKEIKEFEVRFKEI